MCWDETTNGGFSSGKPWLPIYSEYPTRNVKSMQQDPMSLWNFYRDTISLRKQSKALKSGSIETGIDSSEDIFYYTRRSGKEVFHIVLNFSSEEKSFYFPGNWIPKRVILDNYQSGIQDRTIIESRDIHLLPCQAVLIEG
jgi:alpha-glucosidase